MLQRMCAIYFHHLPGCCKCGDHGQEHSCGRTLTTRHGKGGKPCCQVKGASPAHQDAEPVLFVVCSWTILYILYPQIFPKGLAGLMWLLERLRAGQQWMLHPWRRHSLPPRAEALLPVDPRPKTQRGEISEMPGFLTPL